MLDPRKNLQEKLHRLWLSAIAVGALALLGAMYWVVSPQGPGWNWIWVVAAFGFAAIAYNTAFFSLCSVFASSLANLVEDDTEVQGDTVTHVVRRREVRDEAVDFYVRAYATARAISATAIVSGIMIAIALWFF